MEAIKEVMEEGFVDWGRGRGKRGGADKMRRGKEERLKNEGSLLECMHGPKGAIPLSFFQRKLKVIET